MAHCPICNKEYDTEAQVEWCDTCGWNLKPYPLTFSGNLPEAFVEKEQANLTWAKQMWVQREAMPKQSQMEEFEQERSQRQSLLSEIQAQLEQMQQERSQLQSQLSDIQLQLKSVNEQVSVQESQLKQLKQEKGQLKSQLEQAQLQLEESNEQKLRLQSQIEHLRQKISHLEPELAQVLSRLQKLSKQNASDAPAVLSHLDWQLGNIETQLQLARTSLSQWIPNLIEQLTDELAYISDNSAAIAQLDNLLRSGQQRHVSQPDLVALLNAIKSALETPELEKIKEHFTTVVNNNPITQVDALLRIRRELKIKGIITRDIEGDILL